MKINNPLYIQHYVHVHVLIFPLCFHSNKCSQSHHLVSCFPVSLKDQLKVTIRCNNEGLESRKQGAGLDVGVVKEAAAHVIQPGTSMEVQLDLNPTYVYMYNIITCISVQSNL